jgi:hypothetical protein
MREAVGSGQWAVGGEQLAVNSVQGCCQSEESILLIAGIRKRTYGPHRAHNTGLPTGLSFWGSYLVVDDDFLRFQHIGHFGYGVGHVYASGEVEVGL